MLIEIVNYIVFVVVFVRRFMKKVVFARLFFSFDENGYKILLWINFLEYI